MKKKAMLALSVLAAASLLYPGGAMAGRALSDAEMETVAAGSVNTEFVDSTMYFSFSKAGDDFDVSGDGSLDLLMGAPDKLGSIAISGNAQSGLSSLVNITAVDSAIQVLLNLNINVNSSVGSLQQLNLSGSL
ncbi:MAG: hypothetical protein HYV24_06210 [Deltaproteobacteria bacterium]|nr:hypothetical protein [Deltaproteobacteria bacterium]